MTMQNLVYGGEAGRWEQAIYAFLAEKERRSGSMRTVQGYSRMLYRFPTVHQLQEMWGLLAAHQSVENRISV